MTPKGIAFIMKPTVPLCLALLPVLAACETTRAPTPAELFAGQAIISINGSTAPVTEAYHRQMLVTPLDVERDACQVATTDEVVAAVNDIVRQAKPLPRDAKVLPEDFVFDADYTYPAGTPLLDVVGKLLIDSQGRTVILGNSVDWDGNRHILNAAESEEIDRIIDVDSVYRQCMAQTHEWRR